MAVTVPVDVIMQILQAVMRAGTVRAGYNAAIKRDEWAARLRALEVAAQRDEAQQHAALYSQLIEAYRDSESQPFLFAEKVFSVAYKMLSEQQLALLEEKKELMRQRAEIERSDKRKLIYLNRMETTNTNALADIRRRVEKIQGDALRFAEARGSSFRLPALPVVYRLP